MSTIAIVGVTGFTGAALAEHAVARGHQVRGLSRTTPSAPLDGVEYRTGDAATPDGLVAGADVVIGALSPRAGSEGTLVRTYATLAAAARDAGARLVVIGGFSGLRPADGAPRFSEGDDLPPEFAAEAVEVDAVRAALEAEPEGLDWLFVSPAANYGAYLPNDAPRGTYRTGGDVALFDADGVSAIDVADFALAVIDEIETPTRSRAQIHFAY